GQQAQEAELGARLVMGGDERAAPLSPDHQVLGRELVDRLADRALADSVTASQLHLARDRFARLPLARLQALRQQPLDLNIERHVTGNIGHADIPRYLIRRLGPGLVHAADSTPESRHCLVTFVLYKISIRIDTAESRDLEFAGFRRLANTASPGAPLSTAFIQKGFT